MTDYQGKQQPHPLEGTLLTGGDANVVLSMESGYSGPNSFLLLSKLLLDKWFAL